MKYLLAIDRGTTGSRRIMFAGTGTCVAPAQRAITGGRSAHRGNWSRTIRRIRTCATP
jgi:glycerol kinase